MPQAADFGGFYYDPAPNPLAYRAVTVAICQLSRQPLRELPTRKWIISRVIAKSAGSGEPVFTLMDALLYGP
jgi:hypothetical protein